MTHTIARAAWLALLIMTNQGGHAMEHRLGQRSAAEVFADPAVRQLADAACAGRSADVAAAVKAGSNPNAVGLQGLTPLVWALHCGSTDGVRALLAAGARPDQTIGELFSSAVLVAAGQDNPALLQLLLEAGASGDAYDLRSDQTALGLALSRGIQSGDWRHWQLLLPRADINQPYDATGDTIAIRAASLGRFDRVLELLDRGYRYRLNHLGRTLQVVVVAADSPLARDRALAQQRLEALGVRFPVGVLPREPVEPALLAKLPVGRR